MAKTGYMGFTSIFILIILVLSMAFLVPSMYLALGDRDSASFQQETNNEIAIRGDLTTVLTEIDTNTSTADITIFHKSDSVAVSDISEGETREITISDYTVTVTLDLIISETTVSTSYEYPLYIDWPNGAQYIIENTVLIIIAMALLLIVGLTLMSYKLEN